MKPRRPIGSLLVVLSLVVATALASPAKKYGHGGHGLHATQYKDYQGVLGCFFKEADLNHDGQLSEVELRIVLNKYLSTHEQVLDQLTPHRILAQCDTDSSRQVTWAEATEEPRCLTLAQTEGLAKWVCSRAEHSDFSFSEFVQLSEDIERGLLSGKGLKSIQTDLQALRASQNAARRAALARRLHAPRISSEVDALLNDLGSVTQVFAIPIAVVIVVFALIVALVA